MAFVTHEENGLIWLSSDLIPVPHGFSTRAGGVSRAPWDSLNLRTNTRDDPDAVRENYRRFCAAVSAGQTAYEGDNGGAYAVEGSAYAVDVRRVVLAKQVHETIVRPVTAADAGKGLWRDRDYQSADALITDDPGVPLFVFSADCGNILLYDSVTGAVGAVHAGWRGCAGGIVEKAVKLMERRYGSDYPNLYAAIGPCIGPCCFETDHDVPDAMRRALGADADAYLTPPFKEGKSPLSKEGTTGSMPSKWHVDLAGLNRLWLIRAGVPPEHIDVCSLCTACHPDLFWSHRKMGDRRGVQAAVIVKRPMSEGP